MIIHWTLFRISWSGDTETTIFSMGEKDDRSWSTWELIMVPDVEVSNAERCIGIVSQTPALLPAVNRRRIDGGIASMPGRW